MGEARAAEAAPRARGVAGGDHDPTAGEALLALDAGGTSLKAALMPWHDGAARGDASPLPDTRFEIPMADERGVPRTVAAFAEAGARGAALARERGLRVRAAGVSCPGPFDYTLGVSHMVHKWTDALNVPLRPALLSALGGAEIVFLHDSTAFLLGEMVYGAARGAETPCGVMLGTGFGFASARGGRVLVAPDQRPRVCLWNAPFRDGTVEDAVSRRAIRARFAAKLDGTPDSANLSGVTPPAAPPPDVKEIAAWAAEDTPRGEAARATFRETGALLAEALAPTLDALGCDRLVLGGGISRAAALFLPETRARSRVDIRLAAHPDDAALRGVLAYCALGHAAAVCELTAPIL